MNKIIRKLLLSAILVVLGTNIVQAVEPFSRHFDSQSFIPKGQWVTGVSVNYTQSKENNYQFFIAEDIEGDVYTFKVSPSLLYIFKDDMGLGGRLAYSRTRTNVNNARVVIDSETDYKVDNLYMISQDYSGMGVFRYYIGFGSQKRFGMLCDTQLELGFGQTKMYNGTGADFTGSFADNFSLNVGVAPGMVMFLNNYSAIEVNVGVLGFRYKHSRQIDDRIHVSEWNANSANFKLNLFSISFGVSFYL